MPGSSTPGSPKPAPPMPGSSTPGSSTPAPPMTDSPEIGPASTTRPAQPARDTSCPRCGYDQTGVIETWRESCPLKGTCSECGLEFRWAEVLDPRKQTPGWYVETRRPFPATWTRTMFRAAIPPRLWKRVPLGALFNPRRLLLCVACAYSVAHIALLSFILIAEYATWYGGDADYIVQFTRPALGGRGRWIQETVFANLLLAIIWPLVAINHYCMNTGVWWARSNVSPMPIVCSIVCVLVPLCFTLLPHTLNVYKIRARHILRIAMLGTCVAFFYISVSSVFSGAIATIRGFASTPVLLLLSGLPFVPWSIWFWWSAARHYLRIPHALAVSACLHAIACIVTLLVPPVSEYLMHNFVLIGY